MNNTCLTNGALLEGIRTFEWRVNMRIDYNRPERNSPYLHISLTTEQCRCPCQLTDPQWNRLLKVSRLCSAAFLRDGNCAVFGYRTQFFKV